MSHSVVFLEPWYGGSHRAFLDSWSGRSRHRIEVLGLPPRHWQWRMEASPWELAKRLTERGSPPGVIGCSDYVDLPRLVGFLPPEWAKTPTLAYFHENQLTYPSSSETPTTTYGFTNILTAIRADALVFNSEFHRSDFRAAAVELLGRLPAPSPLGELEAALDRSHVIAPAPALQAIDMGPGGTSGSPLRVLFPHRLEHDKDPRAFVAVVQAALEREANLEVVFVGGALESARDDIRRAVESIARVTVSAGYRSGRSEYFDELRGSDVVASTARHEFFGVAVAEAMAAGCTPLVPSALAYPELLAALDTVRPVESLECMVDMLCAHGERTASLRMPAHRLRMRRAALGFDVNVAARSLDELVHALAR